MRQPVCVMKNRAEVAQLISLAKELTDSIENAEMADHDREQQEASLHSLVAAIKKAHARFLGMTLATSPDSDRVNQLLEDFIARGGDYQEVTVGMAMLKKEHDLDNAEADRERRAAEWDAMSTTEQREGVDAQRRQRVASGNGLPGERG